MSNSCSLGGISLQANCPTLTDWRLRDLGNNCSAQLFYADLNRTYSLGTFFYPETESCEKFGQIIFLDDVPTGPGDLDVVCNGQQQARDQCYTVTVNNSPCMGTSSGTSSNSNYIEPVCLDRSPTIQPTASSPGPPISFTATPTITNTEIFPTSTIASNTSPTPPTVPSDTSPTPPIVPSDVSTTTLTPFSPPSFISPTAADSSPPPTIPSDVSTTILNPPSTVTVTVTAISQPTTFTTIFAPSSEPTTTLPYSSACNFFLHNQRDNNYSLPSLQSHQKSPSQLHR
ncbi:conserved hypothetical protein [Talaromyces stipitatus ATCC 10500]|uniref:Uncharacterized protein n=1 Tax=Talaromyces stipitatus (strain ATCC 10500 / CBS 375.48 / QM 6759 / NRRL 1006) TaxID=441959 RepID=B8MUE8_TALSN|nr:uncharacterized protein TSTA_109670 [Talaromyces stipitatus ATCC 10500]EED11787.1 conserved hypothetical protein [Talaromyces stipitatus ATCC 10500]